MSICDCEYDCDCTMCQICFSVPCDGQIIIASIPDDPANEFLMCESCFINFYPENAH